GGGLGPAPFEKRMGDAAGGEPGADAARLGGAVRAQPVIDDERGDAAAARAQRSARIARARLSGPPDTATARRGAGSNPPSAAIAAANSASPSGLTAGSGAAEALLLGGRALLDRGAGPREVMVELGKGDAGVLLLVGVAERHAELEQLFGRLGALGIALVALGEDGGGIEIAGAGVIGLA